MSLHHKKYNYPETGFPPRGGVVAAISGACRHIMVGSGCVLLDPMEVGFSRHSDMSSLSAISIPICAGFIHYLLSASSGIDSCPQSPPHYMYPRWNASLIYMRFIGFHGATCTIIIRSARQNCRRNRRHSDLVSILTAAHAVLLVQFYWTDLLTRK